jgi:hypothetical protein
LIDDLIDFLAGEGERPNGGISSSLLGSKDGSFIKGIEPVNFNLNTLISLALLLFLVGD